MFKTDVMTTGRRRRRWNCLNCEYKHEATERLYVYTCRGCGVAMPVVNNLLERYLGYRSRLHYHTSEKNEHAGYGNNKNL